LQLNKKHIAHILVFIAVLFGAATKAYAQFPLKFKEKKQLNLSKYDRKMFHFGFSLGMNYSDIAVKGVKNIQSLDSVYVVEPDSGEFKVGETVEVAYVDQQHQAIDPNKTVWETISDGLEEIELGGRRLNSRAYVSRFNFGGGDQGKKVEMLSGGERNRLHLAMTLKQEANVLLLDEPTNDIDVNTLRALEEGLESFAGCAVIISHDRWFLDRI